MKKLSVLFILFLFVGLVPFSVFSKIVHTTSFPSTIINVNQNLNTQGDGYIPIPFEQRFYYINHHATSNNTSFGCIDKNGGSACGAGWPRRLPDGFVGSSTLSSSTSGTNEEYSIIGDKLYYAVTRFPGNAGNTPQDWGLGCFDLANHTECGYQMLSTPPNSRQYKVAVEGPFVIGNKFYLLDLEMKLYCLDLSAGLPAATCGTLDLSLAANGGLPKYTQDTFDSNRPGHIGGRVVGNKLYLTVLYMAKGALINPTTTPLSKQAICITESMSPCWSGAKLFSKRENIEINFSNYIYYVPWQTSVKPVSLCNRGSSTQSCLSLADGSDASANHAIFDTKMNPSNLGLGKEVTIGSKTYFPTFYGNAIHCFDWKSQDVCSGWSTPKQSPSPNPRDYALSVDDAGCIWALGDEDVLWSLDPLTQNDPCNVGQFFNTVEKSCPESNWVNFNVSGITPSNYDSLEVRIKNSSGVWVTRDLLNSASINLNTTAFKNVSPLEYEVIATFASGVTAYTTTPVITINDNYKGRVVACKIPPPLLCSDGTLPPCITLPPIDFCCTPWTKSALESTFQAIPKSVGLNADYTLQYNSNVNVDNQINKYVALLQAFNPAIVSMKVDFDLREHGQSSLPAAGSGNLVPAQTISWPSGVPSMSFWNGFPLKVGTWYGIHTKIRITNDSGTTVNILDKDCVEPKLFYKQQLISFRNSRRAPKQAVLLISDGKSILKTVPLQIKRDVRKKPSNPAFPSRR